jgi:hypothetical protein
VAGPADRANGFHFARALVEHVDAETTIFSGKPKFSGRDQVNRHVIFQPYPG